MEIVDNNTEQEVLASSGPIDDKLVEKLEKKFEKAQKAYEGQEYSIEITKESMEFLTTTFGENVKFKGPTAVSQSIPNPIELLTLLVLSKEES